MDDDALREALITKAASELARLVTWTRAERAVRGDDDRHAAWLDEMIAGLEPLAADVGVCRRRWRCAGSSNGTVQVGRGRPTTWRQ